MARTPTDLEILSAIHDRYYDDFAAYDEETNKTRSSKIYMPIDIGELSKAFGIDEDILFGRLYYHLQEKYGYKQDDNVRVPFFTLQSGRDHHCVNFPYLASIVASMRDEDRKYRIATSIAVTSLVLSVTSLGISIFA